MAKNVKNQISNLLSGNVSLISTGRSRGTSYTDAEYRLAVTVAAAVLTGCGFGDFHEHTTQEVVDVVNAIAESDKAPNDVPGWCRAVYRAIEKQRLADPSTAEDFPKQKNGERVGRDHTSLGLLFRHGLKELEFDQEKIDQAFPPTTQSKSSAG